MNNYAIVGLGFIAPRHISAIKSTGGKILMACDIDRNKHLPGIPCTTSYEFLTALPRWKDVHTIVICTPNDLHVEIARWAEKHGKSVICEKPFALKDDLDGFEKTFVVMQLRHHPLFKALSLVEIKDIEDAHMYVRVKRGHDYWSGWKGQENRSGGILFNLGVHYIDAAIQLFGNNYDVIESDSKEREAYSVLRFKGLKNPLKMTFSITDTDEGQDRFLMIDGRKYQFSDKDNLSFEDLHVKVYEDFLKGKGVRPDELKNLTKLIMKLK